MTTGFPGSTRCNCQSLTVSTLCQEGGFIVADDIAALRDSAENDDENEQVCPLCSVCWAVVKQAYPSHYKRWIQRALVTRQDPNRAKDVLSNKITGSGWEYPIALEGKFNFEIVQHDGREAGSEPSSLNTTSLLRPKPEGAKATVSKININAIKGHFIPPVVGVFASPGSKGATFIQERSSTLDGTRVNLEACLDLVGAWIHTCRTRHSRCALMESRKSETGMPTRILDVTSGPNPKLVFTNSSIEAARYIALSYCWGSSDPSTLLRLTSETVHSLTKGHVEATQFTKTHQEAFHLARLLEVQYIWIDALCIFQDDPGDWADESRKLADIYGSAYLTLVAGSSADARDGFLDNRISGVRPCPIPLDSSTPNVPFLYATLLPSTDEGPTAKRGWCYQEAVLSARSVVFGAEQMIYRCPSGTTFEFPMRNDRTLLQQAIVPPRATPIFQPDVQLLGKSAEDARHMLLQHWYMMLRDFTGRQFTNPSDVFPSMSSLSKLVANHLAASGQPSRYLAGIWETDLVRGLLWRARYDKSQPVRLTRPVMRGGVERAPSWSWAAVDGGVDHIDFEPHGGIREETTKTAGDWVPDGAWIRDSVFSTKPGFIRVHPAAIDDPATAGRSWSLDTACGPDVLHMSACELQMTGPLKRGVVSDQQVNMRRWKPRHDWRPLPHRGKMNMYDGRRPRFEDALSIYAHGFHLHGDEDGRGIHQGADGNGEKEKDGKEMGSATAVFDVEEEFCKNVWCLQVTEVEGLILRLVQGDLDKDERDESTGKEKLVFRRLGLFWLEDRAWFDGAGTTEIRLV